MGDRDPQNVTLRPIQAADDPRIRDIIVRVMTEFGAVGEGFAIVDPEVDAMSVAYGEPGHRYLVAEHGGEVLGGAGVAPLIGGPPGVCELRKMYILPEARGLGVGRALLDACLEGARELGYRRCYLETLEHMTAARRLYEKNGFRRLGAPEGATGHYGCDSWYALDL